MKKLRRFFLWYALLTRRLLRRPAYVAVLLLVPLFALALSLFAGQDSGVLTIALCRENPDDPAAAAAVARLTEGESVLRFYEIHDPDAAREAVRRGQADAAWLFAGDLEAQLDRFARRGRADAVTVLQREDNILLQLAREKLFAAMYHETSFAIFSDYLSDGLGAGPLERAERSRWYDSRTISERMLRFETLDGAESTRSGSPLTAPLRGLMALLPLLCGMASGLYCTREEREGCYVWLPARARRFLPLLSHTAAIVPAALAGWLAMALGGVSVGFRREAAIFLLYAPAAACFCELIRCLCPREEHYGALIPVLTVAMLVFCPVFADLALLPALRLLLPPTWALRAAWDAAQLAGLALYALVLFALTALAAFVRQKRRGL